MWIFLLWRHSAVTLSVVLKPDHVTPPPTYERCASASSSALFSFHEPTQTKELRLRFPLSDASILVIVLFCEDSRFGAGLDWQWVTTTRPAWKIHFAASWNISVRRFKRPTPSWKRTWRLLEMIGFTGGWEAMLICNWANIVLFNVSVSVDDAWERNCVLQIILFI